jgi:hypothetical protein
MVALCYGNQRDHGGETRMHAYQAIYTRFAALWDLNWEWTAPRVRETPRDAVWCRVAAEAPLLTRAYR